MKNEDYIKMFGVTKAELVENYTPRMARGRVVAGPFDFSDVEMFTMSILSDAQHVLALGGAEEARQMMNRAKWVLSEVVIMKRELLEKVA